MTTRPEITTDEQVKILKRARNLINSPANWVMENWKCEVVAPDEKGDLRPVTNENGGKAYQYCIEGAVNQATYDVLGEDRAFELGACKYNAHKGELEFIGNKEELGWDPTQLLGLNALAQKEYGYDTALEYNDSPVNDDDPLEPDVVHRGVLHLLTTKLEMLVGRKA